MNEVDTSSRADYWLKRLRAADPNDLDDLLVELRDEAQKLARESQALWDLHGGLKALSRADPMAGGGE